MLHNPPSHFSPNTFTEAQALQAVHWRADVGHCLECGCTLHRLADVLCNPCLAELEADGHEADECEDLAPLVATIIGAAQPARAALQLALL